MASVSRNRVYVLLIALLLISNLALVGFFVLNKPAEKNEVRRDRPSSYMKDALKNEVGFNDQQISQFDQIVTQHRQMMRPLFEDISKTKENFYHLLTVPGVSDSALNTASNLIGEKQKQIDLRIFRHFQNIRRLCTPSQQPQFDSVIQRVVHRMIFPTRRTEPRKDSTAVKNN